MRQIQRLNALKVRDLSELGRHADGDGLYLQIDKDSSSRYWIFMWKRGGKRRVMGLGSARTVKLKEARKAAEDALRMVRQGGDPIAERKQSRAVVLTFGQAAVECHKTLSLGWSNPKYRTQWLPFLEKYAKPLWAKPVNQIDTDDVARLLSQWWQEQADLAMRLRERVQATSCASC